MHKYYEVYLSHNNHLTYKHATELPVCHKLTCEMKCAWVFLQSKVVWKSAASKWVCQFGHARSHCCHSLSMQNSNEKDTTHNYSSLNG
jgi:hypothetical protein